MRRPVLFALALATAAAPALPARADWQVHRDGSRALVEQAERALLERPDDGQLARRLVRLTGPSGRTALRGRFEARARKLRTYPGLAAYAQLLLALGDARAAADTFAEALELEPRSLPSWVGRARALTAAGAPTEAIAAYREALRIEQRAAARRPLIDAELALLAQAASQPGATRDREATERAVALRKELVDLEPGSDAAIERWADALEQAGRPAEAAEALERRLASGRVADRLSLAIKAIELRLASATSADLSQAATAVDDLTRRLSANDGRRREVWLLAIKVARRRAMLPELASELSRAAARTAGPVEWDLLGQVRDELGDLDGALEATRTALARAPRDAELSRRLVAILGRLGREEEATAALEEMVRRNPAHPRFAIELIERRFRRGQRPEALAGLDRALVRFGRDRGALLELAALAGRWSDEGRALAIWQRLRRIDPTSEVAIIGLGEAQFQRGKPDEARRTWALLLEGGRSAAGHLRLAEVLLEHDLTADAAVEARRAQVLDPKSIAPHRLLALVFERQKRIDDAIAEWTLVLSLAVRPDRASGAEAPGGRDDVALRREARVRMLTLLARQGRGRLELQIRKLRAEVVARPDDVEGAMFLAEAQQRAGDAAGAIQTLRTFVDRPRADALPDPVVEATFALIQLLKRTGQASEAMTRLNDVSRRAPARAREAHLQMADLALTRYDPRAALSHAAAAIPGADGQTLTRIADLQSRAGADELAIATYRQAMAGDAAPAASLSLARLLQRRGEAASVAVLDGILGRSRDDEVVVEAGRLAVDIHELLGTTSDLEKQLADGLAAGLDDVARRRTLVALLKRTLPRLYRDPGADTERLRIGRRALRPLLEAITDIDQVPDRGAVELLGMLGHGDAAPALARLTARPVEVPRPARGLRLHGPVVPSEVQLAAVISLARLGDPRGRAALERHVSSSDTQTRAAAIWGLGRLPDGRQGPLLLKALSDRSPEVAAAACLGLGRHPDDVAVAALVGAATDPRRAPLVRRAALVGLGRTEASEAVAVLFTVMDGADGALSAAAGTALAWIRHPRVVPGLLKRALLPGRFALSGPEVPLAALAVWAAGERPPDEARRYLGGRLELELLLMPPPATSTLPSTVIEAFWRAHGHELQEQVGEALGRSGDARREALAALNARRDGVALGALTGDAWSSEASGAAREIVLPLADRLAALLDDPESDAWTRAAAIDVLAKLGDERVTPARIALATLSGSPALVAAAASAAGRLYRDRPGPAASVIAAVAPALTDESWRARLAAVEILAVLTPASLPTLERALTDRHPLVRSSATAALARGSGNDRVRLDLTVPPSRMP